MESNSAAMSFQNRATRGILSCFISWDQLPVFSFRLPTPDSRPLNFAEEVVHGAAERALILAGVNGIKLSGDVVPESRHSRHIVLLHILGSAPRVFIPTPHSRLPSAQLCGRSGPWRGRTSSYSRRCKWNQTQRRCRSRIAPLAAYCLASYPGISSPCFHSDSPLPTPVRSTLRKKWSMARPNEL